MGVFSACSKLVLVLAVAGGVGFMFVPDLLTYAATATALATADADALLLPPPSSPPASPPSSSPPPRHSTVVKRDRLACAVGKEGGGRFGWALQGWNGLLTVTHPDSYPHSMM